MGFVLWTLLIGQCLGRVSYLGYPNNGVIAVSCQSSVTFPVGLSFAQTCLANNCAAPVTFTWSPDLTQYGVSLNQISPATLVINPNPLAVAQGSLTTTISASDQDGPPASAPITINYDCPLLLGSQIPNQTATESQPYSFDVAPFFSNPSRNPLTWVLEGLPSSSTLSINSQGVITGTPSYTEASLVQPLKLTVISTDTVTQRSVRSNTFDLQIAQKPGISFPSALGQIPAQTATEGVLFQLAAGRHFNNPSNFAVVWSIMGGPLTIDPLTGTVSVAPGTAELLATRNQPLTVTITGTDERGNVARSNPFTFTVKPLRITTKPVPMPLAPIMCGSACCSFNLSDFISNPSSNPAQFMLTSGLPFGSQIRMLPDGTLSGTTSMVDVQASPIVLMATVNNGDSTPVPLSPITFNVIPMTAPILSTQPFPPRTVKINTNVQIDMTPYFVIPPSATPTVWTLSSVSPSLSIDQAGRINGILTEQDYLLQPSLGLTVTASNRNSCGGGSASQTVTIMIDPSWQGPNCNSGVNGTPGNIATCERTLVRVDLTRYCSDPRGLALTYNISGLPSNSGLSLSNGVLSGTPTSEVVGSSVVTVCATNTRGLHDCMPSFIISFQHPKRPPIVDPPIPSPVTAVKGQRFVGYFNFHFFEQDFQPLIYSVSGLPIGSGMGIGPITGIFSGTPNEVDFRASPLVLSVFASNEQNVAPGNVCQTTATQGGRARADLLLIVQNPASPPICRPLPPQTGTAQVGQFWAADLSRYFSPGEGATKLEFALRSLPRGSGLSIDAKSGVVSGVLAPPDALYSPLTLVVAATNGYGSCQSNFVLFVGPRASVPSPPADMPCPLSFQNIFPQNSVEGTLFMLDLNQYISHAQPNMRLSFVSNGWPRGTGFFQDASGIFSGFPSKFDMDQGSLTVVTTVSCGAFGRPISKQWQLIVSRRNAGGVCNACFNNNGGCQQQCVVLNPQNCFPTCGCGSGFVLNADGRSCRPIGGCDQNNGGCGSVCNNNQGLPPVCSCPPNWLLQPDKQTCRYDPCGWNNGGCEQICTSDGDKARCDCRTGALSSDGRTCSNDITVVGTIPPALVLGCQQFIFDLSTAFSRPSGGPLSFSISGLPPQTGFSVTQSGLLSGTPTSADCAMAQPMTLGINAMAGSASVRAVMFMSAFCGACGGSTSSGGSAQPQPIPVLHASVCEAFRFDMAPYFVGGQGSIQFSVLGLPQGSGFQMATQGLLSGVPTDRDCAESPLLLTIIARDALGRTSKAVATVRFSSCNCMQPTIINIPPSQITIPLQISVPGSQITIPPAGSASSRRIHNTAQCGQPFFVDCAEVFRVNGLMYTMRGLPPNSGLRLSDTGVLSGTPNNADARASPFSVYVTATDRFGVAELLQVEVEIIGDCGGLPAPVRIEIGYRSGIAIPAQDSNTGILPIQVARKSQVFYLDLARISFSGLSGDLSYEAKGLPEKSGLSLSHAGLLVGLPSEADCALSSRPVRVTVRVSAGKESVEHILYIQFLCDNKPVVLPVINGDLPIAVGVVDELFYYDTTPYLTAPNTDLSTITFECQGLAPNSNLRISNTGIISGVPSVVDMNGPALLVSARDNNNGNVVQSTLRLLIRKKQLNNTAPIFVPLEVLKAPKDKLFGLNVKERFYDMQSDNLTFSIEGLSPASGLGFDESTGILSGIPSSFDLRQLQPVRFRVFADDGRGGRTEGPIFITFSESSKGVSKVSAPMISTGLNRDPVSIGIRRQVATQGVPFLMSVASSFVDQDGDLLSYALSGLPMGTGLAIDGSGMISGTPNAADAAALQPLLLTVTVKDGQGGSCDQDFLLTVFHGQSSMNHAPVAQVVPDAVAYVDELLMIRASYNFADVDGDMLYYAMSGQPARSGLTMNAMAGVVSGIPTSADLGASPLYLSIMVDDGRGGTAYSSLRIVVNPSRKTNKKISTSSGIGASSTASATLKTRTMPRLNATDGTQINFIAKNYFQSLSHEVMRYEVYGLPMHTGFQFDKESGIFTGIPSRNDFAAKQPLAVGFIACNKQQQCLGNILFIDCQSKKHAMSTTALLPDFVAAVRVSSFGVPEIVFQVAAWGFFQTSRYFPSFESSGSISYEIAGLDMSISGLKFDPTSGVIHGIPNLNDVISADSCAGRCIPIVVTCSDGNVQTFVLKFILSRTEQLNHAPLARAIEKQVVSIDQQKVFLFDVWTSFVDPDGDPLEFYVLGLPQNSGFSMIASSGVLFGIPSQSDLAMSQPMVLTVVASDQKGGKVQETLTLTFTNSSQSNQPKAITRTCSELGWSLVNEKDENAFCTRILKISGSCPPKMTFLVAEKTCNAAGARLCSSQELSSYSSSSSGAEECEVDKVWSSSECANSQAIVQSTRGPSPIKACQAKSDQAMLRCCAHSNTRTSVAISPVASPSSGFVPMVPPQASAKTCDQLPNFVTAPTALNKAVCSFAAVGAIAACSGPVTFSQATKFCERIGARLCTSDEIAQDIGNDEICEYGLQRIWSSSLCEVEGQVISQAGSSALLRDIPKNCTSVADLLPVFCCADQKAGEYFRNLKVVSGKDTLLISWTWKLFPRAQLSFRKSGSGQATWITPQAALSSLMGGDASFILEKLDPNTKYVIRLTPSDSKNQAVPTQVVEFRAATLM